MPPLPPGPAESYGFVRSSDDGGPVTWGPCGYPRLEPEREPGESRHKQLAFDLEAPTA